jgi:ribonuclease HII
MLTVGIDEVGYGPSLGPLVMAAAAARRPLRAPVPIGDSKKLFSQARGPAVLEPAVLGFVPAATFRALLGKLSAALPEAPWYGADVELPPVPAIPGLDGAWAAFVDPAEFNARTGDACNKSDLLFDLAAELIRRIRAAHAGPVRFLVGKQGGRRRYRRGLAEKVSDGLRVLAETPRRSAYAWADGTVIEFLQGAEDRHELVALASMIGKYVRERAMGLFNAWCAGHVEGLRPTAGYGTDARRFWAEIEPVLARLGVPAHHVRRLR